MTLTLIAALSVAHGYISTPILPRLDQDKAATAQDKAATAAKVEEDTYAKTVKDYTAQDGVFKVWRQKENVMYEIPKDVIGRDFLWVTEIKKTPGGMYNGSAVADNVVRWEIRDDKVLLRLVNYSVRATNGGPEIQAAVEQSNVMPIIRTFDIKARGKDGAPLIDVGQFYKNDIPEFSVRGAVAGSGQDPSRTFYDKISVFPNNINIDVMMTFMPGGAGFSPFGGVTGNGPRTCVVSHSMSLLPAVPMMGRIKDSRVGYFSTGVEDYGTDYHGVKDYEFINRYRLEKKDPTAAVSEPVKPIVYYISREVPAKWHPYIKQAVEDWQVAFEAAGFKNAIICKDAPTEKEDPNWSPEDSRYSVIRWAPLPIANAMGPSVADPRSGEIISAHIILWHDVLKLQTDWYFSQASVNDARARRLPYTDELEGRLLRFVVAHEVGHTLGLPHNGKSSAMIPIGLLRDPKWCAENGTCTSIMDYARFNYVAQPGDGVEGDNLIPKIGRYDKFAIKWGYTPISGIRDPFAERAILDSWAAAQVNDPQLRFYDNFSSSDPTAQAEALGDNAVVASALGVKNLKRVIQYVRPASVRTGEDYSEMARLHGAVFGQFARYLSHVLVVFGGVEQIDFRGGRGGAVYNPMGRAYQKSAVQYVIDQVFTTPTWLFPQEIADKVFPDMGLSRIRGIQRSAARGLLSDSRLVRVLQQEAVNPNAFTVAEMLSMVRGGVWSELAQNNPKVDYFRRGLQREWINALTEKLSTSSDIRAIAMGELAVELKAINSGAARSTDATTKGHLLELKKQVEFALANPDKAAPAAQSFVPPFLTEIDQLVNPVSASCPIGGH